MKFLPWPEVQESRIVLILLLVTIVSAAPVGYHMVVLNVPAEVLREAITQQLLSGYSQELNLSSLNLLWSFIVSCQSIGALFGCVALVPFERFYGAKTSLFVINNGILFVGSLSLFISFYVETALFLVIGRLLIGVYTGLVTGLLPIYIQELAPTRIKGTLSCFIHIAVLMGSSISALLSLDSFLGNSKHWHFLLTLPIVCAILQCLLAQYLPHTPGFFLAKGKRDQAAHAIKYYYDVASLESDVIVHEYRQMVKKMPEQLSFKEAIKRPNIRKGIALGMLVSATQIFTGSMATATYSTSMFESVSLMNSLVPLLPTIGSILSIILSLPALKFVESCGRRPLLIITLTMCAIANFLLCIFSISLKDSADGSDPWVSAPMFAAFLLLGIGYNLGTGPIAYFVPGELVNVHFVSVAMSCAVATNWTANLLTTFLYYPLNAAIGGWSYLMFALPTTLSIFVIKRYLPETKYTTDLPPEPMLLCNVHFPNTDDTIGFYGTFS